MNINQIKDAWESLLENKALSQEEIITEFDKVLHPQSPLVSNDEPYIIRASEFDAKRQETVILRWQRDDTSTFEWSNDSGSYPYPADFPIVVRDKPARLTDEQIAAKAISTAATQGLTSARKIAYKTVDALREAGRLVDES